MHGEFDAALLSRVCCGQRRVAQGSGVVEGRVQRRPLVGGELACWLRLEAAWRTVGRARLMFRVKVRYSRLARMGESVHRIPRLASSCVCAHRPPTCKQFPSISPRSLLPSVLTDTNTALPCKQRLHSTCKYIATDHIHRPVSDIASIPYFLTQLHHSAKFHQPRRIIRGMSAAC